MKAKGLCMKNNNSKKGSFTVEAAIIMPLIFIVIIMLIYVAFFLYNRCIIAQKTYIAALRGCLYEEGVTDKVLDRNAYITKQKEDLYENKLIAAQSSYSNVNVEKKEIVIKSGILVKVPFSTLLKKQGYKNGWQTSVEKRSFMIDEVDFIRSCKKLERLNKDGI